MLAHAIPIISNKKLTPFTRTRIPTAPSEIKMAAKIVHIYRIILFTGLLITTVVFALSGVPQFGQKLAPSANPVPHFGQNIYYTSFFVNRFVALFKWFVHTLTALKTPTTSEAPATSNAAPNPPNVVANNPLTIPNIVSTVHLILSPLLQFYSNSYDANFTFVNRFPKSYCIFNFCASLGTLNKTSLHRLDFLCRCCCGIP